MRAIMGLLGLVLAFSGVTAAQNASVIVPTESGLVQGVIEGDVRAFRGIPFAAPPVGDLRWRPPASPAQWSGISGRFDVRKCVSAARQHLLRQFCWERGLPGPECLRRGES